ncbi:MAG: hypothetical protein IR158_17235 [Cellulomonas sp.]|uniref:hypothetical protein n=1 Tax=Cellulomonas sp. TaxID=40001 RepID=UPI001A04608B|nr:hypothetical protein [Cellulomonas sp.]MBF0689496.1 hypothetical protein [Cellulomonas sp.]
MDGQDVRDRGAATLEAYGVVVVAGILVAAMIAGIALYPERISQAFCLLTAVARGDAADCGSTAPPVTDGPTDDDFRPPACMLHEESEKFSSEVKVMFFTFGQDAGFVVQQFADGPVRATVTDGAGIGVSGGITSKTFDVDKLGDGQKAGLDVDLGADLTFSYGDTWEFESFEQWEQMKDDLDYYVAQQYSIRHTENGYLAAKAMGIADPPKDPQTAFSRIELEAGVTAGLGLKHDTGLKDDKGDPQLFDPNIGVGLQASAGTAVVVERDYVTGEESYTYELTAQGSVDGSMVAVSGEAHGMTQGAFTVTRDKSGQATALVFNSVREGGLGWRVGNNSFAAGGGASDDYSDSTVTSTRLEVDDENRALVDRWLADRNDYGVALALPFEAMVPDRPSDDPFLQHLYEKATTSVTTYENVRDKWEFEATVKKGWEFGFSISGEEATADAVVSDFLGAPGKDGVRTMLPDTECVA